MKFPFSLKSIIGIIKKRCNLHATRSSKKFFSGFRWIWILPVCALIVPLLVSLLFRWTFGPGAQNLDAKSWLSFWGSYLGSLLASIVTILAFTTTAKQNDLLRQQNDAMQAQTLEMSRLQSLPFLNVEKRSHDSTATIQVFCSSDHEVSLLDGNNRVSPWSGIYDVICISNIGIGPAIDLYLSDIKIGHLSSGANINVSIANLPVPPSSFSFTARFSDREGRLYQQVLHIEDYKASRGFSRWISSPALIAK